MDIQGVAHVGIRVFDRARALAFYERLGFRLMIDADPEPVLILEHPSGVEINLVVNADLPGPNVLMDVPEKRAGITHLALSVPSADEAARWLDAHGIAITEGPVDLGPVARSVFFRDPDGNVLELTSTRGSGW